MTFSRFGSFATEATWFERVEITRESDTFSVRSGIELPTQLIECLDANKVSYEILRHPEAVTAPRIAPAEHVNGRPHAKVVMDTARDPARMMGLPADHQIDPEKVENAIGNAVSLDQEQ